MGGRAVVVEVDVAGLQQQAAPSLAAVEGFRVSLVGVVGQQIDLGRTCSALEELPLHDRARTGRAGLDLGERMALENFVLDKGRVAGGLQIGQAASREITQAAAVGQQMVFKLHEVRGQDLIPELAPVGEAEVGISTGHRAADAHHTTVAASLAEFELEHSDTVGRSQFDLALDLPFTVVDAILDHAAVDKVQAGGEIGLG